MHSELTHCIHGVVQTHFFIHSLQDDKDLVHQFVDADGLTCLIQVGAEADQNYQNYILRGELFEAKKRFKFEILLTFRISCRVHFILYALIVIR